MSFISTPARALIVDWLCLAPPCSRSCSRVDTGTGAMAAGSAGKMRKQPAPLRQERSGAEEKALVKQGRVGAETQGGAVLLQANMVRVIHCAQENTMSQSFHAQHRRKTLDTNVALGVYSKKI